jgi:hypothetical protein
MVGSEHAANKFMVYFFTVTENFVKHFNIIETAYLVSD